MTPIDSNGAEARPRKKTAGGDSDRDSSGRFAQGNAGGPGRPRRLTREQLLERLADAVTPEAIQEMVAGLIAQGTNGDIPAARLVLELCFGKKVPPLCGDPNVIWLPVPSNFGSPSVASDPIESQRTLPMKKSRGKLKTPPPRAG